LHPFIGHPSYKEISHLPLNERLSIMRDPAFKQKILNESPSFREDLQKAAKEQKSNKTKEEIKAEAETGKKIISNYETQFILSDPPNYEPTREDSIAYLAELRNQSEEEVIYDELIKDDGKSLIYACFTPYEKYKLKFVESFYKLKSSVAGGSDGGAHCGLICDASMPTTNLSHWARDRSAGNKIPLELIIRKQTKDTAETYGLFDRGEIKTGMIADINIIDFEKLNVSLPKMIFDLPKGGKRLVQESFGYLATIKSGEVVYENGQATGALPGQVIRGKQTSEAKDTKEKLSFYDRTVRLFAVKLLRLFWAVRNKPVKSTVIS
jgi:N-acyl-D-aspartate/D-glutamate deacylase